MISIVNLHKCNLWKQDKQYFSKAIETLRSTNDVPNFFTSHLKIQRLFSSIAPFEVELLIVRLYFFHMKFLNCWEKVDHRLYIEKLQPKTIFLFRSKENSKLFRSIDQPKCCTLSQDRIIRLLRSKQRFSQTFDTYSWYLWLILRNLLFWWSLLIKMILYWTVQDLETVSPNYLLSHCL